MLLQLPVSQCLKPINVSAQHQVPDLWSVLLHVTSAGQWSPPFTSRDLHSDTCRYLVWSKSASNTNISYSSVLTTTGQRWLAETPHLAFRQLQLRGVNLPCVSKSFIHMSLYKKDSHFDCLADELKHWIIYIHSSIAEPTSTVNASVLLRW